MEHRDYQPGDDLRRMNWSAYARSDKLVVKVFRQEVCPHFDLVIDGSRSMMLEGTQKLRATLGLAAALACAAENSGYSPASLPDSKWLSANSWRFGPAGSVAGLGVRCRAQSGRIVSHPSARLAAAGHPRAAERLSLAGRSSRSAQSDGRSSGGGIGDSDPGGRRRQSRRSGQPAFAGLRDRQALEVFVDASGQDRYRRNLARHQQDWHLAARRVGATFIPLVAEELCHTWDLSPLLAAEALAV